MNAVHDGDVNCVDSDYRTIISGGDDNIVVISDFTPLNAKVSPQTTSLTWLESTVLAMEYCLNEDTRGRTTHSATEICKKMIEKDMVIVR